MQRVMEGRGNSKLGPKNFVTSAIGLTLTKKRFHFLRTTKRQLSLQPLIYSAQIRQIRVPPPTLAYPDHNTHAISKSNKRKLNGKPGTQILERRNSTPPACHIYNATLPAAPGRKSERIRVSSGQSVTIAMLRIDSEYFVSAKRP